VSESEHVDAPGRSQLSVGVCRWCGKRFTWPKGSRQQGCPQCAPTIMQELERVERGGDDAA
jgi:hypothetical protein